MPKPDAAHLRTEKELAALERRIAGLYREAGDELQATIDNYFDQFKKRDEEMKSLVGQVINGKEWTEQEYKQWRLNQMARGERYQALRDKIAQRMTGANAVAVSYTNDATPGIYSLNRNYAAYTIERVAGNIGFDLWDEQTVKRLIVERPDLMPYYPKKQALKRGIDLAYGKKQITKSMTSSILQGKSLKGMADDLQKRIPTMNRDSAIRTARTAVTGAQNAGRMDSYAAAEKMGIKLKREWVATLDGRTRHAHAMLDGQRAEIDKPFKIDGYEIMYPGDASAPGYLVYNCRCTLVADVEEVDTSDGLRRTRDGLIPDMTYAQWEASKRGYDGKQLSPYHVEDERPKRREERKQVERAGKSAIIKERAPLFSSEQTIEAAKTLALSRDYGSVRTFQELRAVTNKKLGYDGLPTVVNKTEFERAAFGKTRLFRGIASSNDKTAEEIVSEFKYGNLWTGNSGGAVYGNGVYFTATSETAKSYAGNDGILIEAVLSNDARIADYRTIYQEYLDTGIPKIFANREDFQQILGDVGQYAAIKGYDAIALNGFQGHDYIVLLNRTMAIVKE